MLFLAFFDRLLWAWLLELNFSIFLRIPGREQPGGLLFSRGTQAKEQTQGQDLFVALLKTSHKMPVAASDEYFVEIEDSGALDEKLCEKGIKGRQTASFRFRLHLRRGFRRPRAELTPPPLSSRSLVILQSSRSTANGVGLARASSRCSTRRGKTRTTPFPCSSFE